VSLPRVFVLGAGRAGRGLTAALRAAGVPIAALHGRRAEPDASPPISSGSVAPHLANADVALIAVRDAQIDDAVRELVVARPPATLVMLQASGGTEPDAYREARERGHPCGTFHPLLPLADLHEAGRLFRGAWIGIDGDGGARAVSERLAAALGAHTLDVPSNRALYHAGAVLASNFLGVLASVAAEAMQAAGVPAEQANAATRSLLLAAADNMRTRDAAEVITGPIARGDTRTVRAHVEALAPHPRLEEIYRALSRHAIELTRARGVPDETLGSIERLLEAPTVPAGRKT
jgi:predicted short-subunit dehydrogenase-like oxidoreductase (DUF2520 family)